VQPDPGVHTRVPFLVLCNKLPQTWQHKPMQISSLTVPRAQESGYGLPGSSAQGHSKPKFD
jgi:hypothetical protein